MAEPNEEAQKEVERRLEQLRELDLFAQLEDTDALTFELQLLCDPSLIGTLRAAQSEEDGSPVAMPQRASYIRFERFAADDVIVPQGALTTEFFVVLDGLAYAIREGLGRQGKRFDTYQKGDWFGEVSAMSNQPAFATVKAETDCEVVVLDARLFTKLYQDEDGMPFQESIEERYREKCLLAHLQVAPLFAGLADDETQLEEIKAGAEFVRFARGKKIAKEGGDADAFYLVRSGAVKCVKKDDEGKEQVFAYYMANSSFGEHAASTADSQWPGTLETMAPTEVVRIPREVFGSMLEKNPEAHRVVTQRANLIVRGAELDDLTRRTGLLGEDEIEVMVHKGSVKGGEALVIDRTMCIRCNLCVDSCAAVHGDGMPRLSKVGTRVCTDDVVITACYSCAIPDCMANCSYGAIRRDSQGLVKFVYDNCVGCTECTKGCPYGVIRMTEPEPVDPAGVRPGFFEGIPILSWLFSRKNGRRADTSTYVRNIGEEDPLPVGGKAIKCDKCAGLPFEACVYNCPTSAILRRRPEELFKK